MTHCSFLYALPLLWLTLPSALRAQTGEAAPRGWGSTWTEPANEQQRQHQELNRQLAAARKAHDSKAEVTLCNHAIDKEPDNAALYALRCSAFIQAKEYDRALADENHAQALAQQKHFPNMTAWLLVLRSNLDEHRHDYAAAVNDLQTSLKLNEKNALAWNDLAWLRATAPDASVRNGREGVHLAQKAVSLATKRTFPGLDTLAAAYAEAGDYPHAIESEKRALDAAGKELTDADLLRKFRQRATARLQLFEQHQPYHADISTEE